MANTAASRDPRPRRADSRRPDRLHKRGWTWGLSLLAAASAVGGVAMILATGPALAEPGHLTTSRTTNWRRPPLAAQSDPAPSAPVLPAATARPAHQQAAAPSSATPLPAEQQSAARSAASPRSAPVTAAIAPHTIARKLVRPIASDADAPALPHVMPSGHRSVAARRPAHDTASPIARRLPRLGQFVEHSAAEVHDNPVANDEAPSQIQLIANEANAAAPLSLDEPTGFVRPFANDSEQSSSSGASGVGQPPAPRVRELLNRLKDVDPEQRTAAADELGQLGAQADFALPALVILTDDADELVGIAAANALWSIDRQVEPTLTLLATLLDSQRPGVAPLAAYSLGQMGPPARAAIPDLQQFMQNCDPLLRVLVAEAMLKIEPRQPAASAELFNAIRSDEAEIRRQATCALPVLAQVDNERCRAELLHARRDRNEHVRLAAAHALEDLQKALQSAPAAASTELAAAPGLNPSAMAESVTAANDASDTLTGERLDETSLAPLPPLTETENAGTENAGNEIPDLADTFDEPAAGPETTLARTPTAAVPATRTSTASSASSDSQPVRLAQIQPKLPRTTPADAPLDEVADPTTAPSSAPEAESQSLFEPASEPEPQVDEFDPITAAPELTPTTTPPLRSAARGIAPLEAAQSELPSLAPTGPAPAVPAPVPDDETALPVVPDRTGEAPVVESDANPRGDTDESFGIALKPIQSLSTNISASAGDLPEDYSKLFFAESGLINQTTGANRGWYETVYYWDAPALCHPPLYFEDINAERYGYSRGILQPFASAANFFGRIPALPYMMGVNPPSECVYDLGYYRPGSCAPYHYYRLPFSFRASAVQAVATVGLIFLIP